jgi:hypothetical protein
MSTHITIITTANRTLHFTQSDPAQVSEILASLRRCTQLFSNRTLVVVADSGTEVFSPTSITRIEIETDADLTPYLPPAWEIAARALSPGEVVNPASVDDQHIAARLDFFFEGGDTLATWFERTRPLGAAERTMQITRLFEQPIIPYHLTKPGIGFMNPAAMTRASLGIALTDAPASAWHVKNA